MDPRTSRVLFDSKPEQAIAFEAMSRSLAHCPIGSVLRLAAFTVETTVYATRVSRTPTRSEEHTSELQSLMRISYAVFCLKKTHNNDTLTQIVLEIVIVCSNTSYTTFYTTLHF